MNKIHLIFLLILIPTVCAANSTVKVDSLKKILNTNSIDDSTRVVNLVSLVRIYLANEPPNYDLAIETLEAYSSKVEKMNISNRLVGHYLGVLGNLYYTKDSYEGGNLTAKEKSPFYYKKAIPYMVAAKDSVQLAKALLNCGTMIIYNEKSTALAYFKEAAILFEAQNDIDRAVSTYSQLCTVLAALGRIDEALIYSQKALDNIPKLTDYYTVAQSSIGIGIVYLDAKKYEYAEDLFQAADKAAKSGKDDFLIACTQMYLAANRVDKEKVTKAELVEAKQQLDKANQLFIKLENEYVRQYLNLYYASYYLNTKSYNEALKRTNSYINYISKTTETEPLAMAYLKKGYIFEQMNKADSAAIYYNKCLKISKGNENHISIKGTYLHLYELAKNEKNFEAALMYHEQYFNYHDSIYNDKLQDIMGMEGVRFDLKGAQEAQQNAELQAQLLRSQNQLFGAVAIGLFAILLIGGFLFFQLRKARKTLETQNLQLKQLNATKDKFFGIIAHDIRSPITALDSVGEQMTYYLEKNNTVKLQRLATRVDTTAKRLSNLLDNLLNWALLQTGTIPYNPVAVDIKTVSDEILELYEPIATAKNIRLINHIETDKMVFADESSLNAILRNLINNALKFTAKNGEVAINIKAANQKFFIEINDTGTGISAEKLPTLFNIERNSSKGTAGEKGTGLGLMLCKELVELNKGTIKAFSEIGKGSTFVFSIPKPS